MSEAISYVFVWHALSDACPKCRALNGREWREQDLFRNTLWDPIYGNLWDFDADHTLAHPNCRCQLEVRLIPSETFEQDLATLKEQLLLLRDEIRSAVEKMRGR